MAKEEQTNSTEKKEEAPVVFDPVVEDESQTQEEEKIDDRGGGDNQTKMIVGLAILVSFVVYFIFFKSKTKEDIVDNTSIVFNQEGGRVNRDKNFAPADLGVNNNQGNNKTNDMNNYNINDIVPVIPNNEIKIPDLPNLSNDLKKNIDSEINKANEKAFSKEEVDRLINEKLQSFENQMNSMKQSNESLNTAIQEQQRQFQKKLDEQKKETEKRERDAKLNNTITQNLITPPNANNNNNGIGGNNTANSGTVNSGGTAGNNNTKNINPFETKNNNPILGGSKNLSDEEKAAELKKQEDEIKIAQRNRALAERKGTTMFKMQGGGGGDPDAFNSDQSAIIIMNKDLLVNIKDTTSKVEATKVPDLSRVIVQGKVIDAILETAITTDSGAQVRAVVTRDIYAEYGKNILIPKGSRVVGSFDTAVTRGISRVNIKWSRIIRVDGLSLNITATAADRLGRGGVEGELDNKYLMTMQNALLSSIITIAAAATVESVTGATGGNSTTIDANGNTITKIASATDNALIEATQDFSDAAKDITDSIAQQKPTVRIAQGVKIMIMVNEDLNLPIYKVSK